MLELRPSEIELGERVRPLNQFGVETIAKSMSEVGLLQPITVRVVDEMMVEGFLTAGVPVLVAGAHRLAAAKALGWETIECIEIDGDDAELAEIAENLHRLDLTKEQRDEHIRRYAELIEARREKQNRDGQNVQPEVGYKKPPPARKSVATEIAEETGLSARTVRRALNPPEPKAPLADYDVVTVQFNALMNAWNRAGSEARSRFCDEIGGEL